MGYTTNFTGMIDIVPPLPAEKIAVLEEFFNKRHDPNVQPGYNCDLEVSFDGDEIGWNGSEKSYDMAEWMAYVIQNFMRGHILNGTMEAVGEDPDDRWYLHVRDSKVFTEAARITPSGEVHPVHANTEDVPIALPDNSGLRTLNHLELGEYIGDFLKDLGGDAPEEVVAVFKSLFDYPITVNEDGTFTIDENI